MSDREPVTILLAPPGSRAEAVACELAGEMTDAARALGDEVANRDGIGFSFERARTLRDAWHATSPPVLWHPGFAASSRTDPLVIARRLRRLLPGARVAVLMDDPVETIARVHALELGRAGRGPELERWVRARTRVDHYHGRAPDWALRDADPRPLAEASARLFGAERLALVRLEDPGRTPVPDWLGIGGPRFAEIVARSARSGGAKSHVSEGVRRALEPYYAGLPGF